MLQAFGCRSLSKQSPCNAAEFSPKTPGPTLNSRNGYTDVLQSSAYAVFHDAVPATLKPALYLAVGIARVCYHEEAPLWLLRVRDGMLQLFAP